MSVRSSGGPSSMIVTTAPTAIQIVRIDSVRTEAITTT
jgi:hypothetical protein